MRKKRFLVYAPNVHTGGGLTLLNDLLRAIGPHEYCIFWLDLRAKAHVFIRDNWEIHWVRNSFSSRFNAEFSLYKVSRAEDIILCFHGLPPLFKNNGYVFLFLQNRLFLSALSSFSFPLKTILRLNVERFLSRIFSNHVNTYLVQTQSMRNLLYSWSNNLYLDVKVVPFCNITTYKNNSNSVKWDFVYVADGEAHKNHKTLIDSWVMLANNGIYPSLVLTLSDRDQNLKKWVRDQAGQFNLNIFDIGHIEHCEVNNLYGSSKALIFPSKCESFGLPLIEASCNNLPILASELDFVRDVCCPVQTFDPNSATSIFRSVKRFLEISEPPFVPMSARNFLDTLSN